MARGRSRATPSPWEDFRPDAGQFPSSALSSVYSGFEDERWLDDMGQVADLLAYVNLYERYGDQARVVGVSPDSRGPEAQVRRFIEDIGVTFSILLDPDEWVVRQFKTIGVPAIFLIDAEGTLRHRWWGQYRPLSDDNIAILESVI